jgi:hypothetical protein
MFGFSFGWPLLKGFIVNTQYKSYQYYQNFYAYKSPLLSATVQYISTGKTQ